MQSFRKTAKKMIESKHRGSAPHRTLGSRDAPALRWLLLGGWLLMMPPLPLGTELPPLSKWSPVSVHGTAEDCERNGKEMRESARRMLTSDPDASANSLAAAMGRLQATCVEGNSEEPPSTSTKP